MTIVMMFLGKITTEDYVDDFVQGLKYAVSCNNLFFRTLRECGVFIYEPQKTVVYHAGQQMCDTWIHIIRPF